MRIKLLIISLFLSSFTFYSCGQGYEVAYIALSYLGTPYVAGTLEVNEEESLVVNLDEVDCTTLVEYCLARFLSIHSFNDFNKELELLRYREGQISGYSSRLHYICEWIKDNEKKGLLKDISREIGGQAYLPEVNFMSSHPDSYPALTNNSKEIERIREIETNINKRTDYYFIPKKEISEKAQLIKDGDIIAFTTSIKGLDVQHIGIAYWQDKKLTFIHASSKAKKVIINPESLAEYANTQKTITGIMVARAEDNRDKDK
ncbi:DUF1460 domain-containing protein [Bacteroidales bacterium OttesenSCG-928-I14]|nr:DUF1460 domain-containing protein [Bacteroidales bacterium OttesenSCG-928-I14]